MTRRRSPSVTDVAKWVEGHLSGLRKRGASYEADCPACGKSGHLYVHGKRGYFRCFAGGCGFAGRSVYRLVATVEGITLAEAMERMFRDEVFGRRPTGTALAETIARLAGSDEEDTGLVDVPPPASMVPVWDGRIWRMPRYLLERGMSRRLAARYGIGHCDGSLCADAPRSCTFPEGGRNCVDRRLCRYAGRVVLPYACPNGRSFTSRSTDPDDELRYLNPVSPRGRLLYGWQCVAPEADLVLVEGPFDALRLASFGVRAVAVMGLSLSGEQLALLADLRLATATVLLDAGVEVESSAIATRLLPYVGRVYVATPEGRKDPGEMSAEEARECLKKAEQFRADRKYFGKSLYKRLAINYIGSPH